MLMKNTSKDWTTHPRKSQITQENTQTIASHFCDQPSQHAKKLFSLYQSEQFTLDYPIHRINGSSLLLLNFSFRKTIQPEKLLSKTEHSELHCCHRCQRLLNPKLFEKLGPKLNRITMLNSATTLKYTHFINLFQRKHLREHP